ncbi:MAG: hypothetical protein K2N53_06175, partial [Clostridia bacterium]|nr:hypothetical protein [Clostridia bacterium]
MEDKTLNQDLENAKVETGNTPDETPKKKKGIKGFLQLIVFIILSMAGFIVQVIIEQLKNLSIVQDFDKSHSFEMFNISYLLGSFIVTMIAIFVCKVINFILHRKVLFKPRHNLAFGIVMYIIFSVLLWLGSVSIQQPVANALNDALMNSSGWVNFIDGKTCYRLIDKKLVKGTIVAEYFTKGMTDFLATMVYSTADLIIMFFAEKFLIMNDKLFRKKGQEQVAVAEGAANVEEQAVAADSAVQENAQVVAEEVKPVEDIFAQDAFVAQDSVAAEPVEEKAEEQAIEEPIQEESAPVVEETVEVVEDVQETPAVEEPAQEEVIEEIVEEIVEEQVEEVAQEEVEAEAVAEVVEEVEEAQPETVEEPVVEEEKK